MVRAGLLAGLAILAGIGTTSWPQKLLFICGMAATLGTWRRSRLTSKALQSWLTIAFVPLPRKSVTLRRFDFIEIVHEPAVSGLEFVFLGPLMYVWVFCADRLFPGLSGSYQLWLNNSLDDRQLAWQGRTQEDFEQTLERLKLATGLRAKVR